MINALVLYNPIAGGGRTRKIPYLIKKYLDASIFNYEIQVTQYAGHAAVIAEYALTKNIDLIIIAGGDGSINEIAKVLVDTSIKLAFIPCGSGNGIARHLNISLSAKKAIQRINTFNIQKIDAGKWNDHFFLGFSGLGFDGHIANLFQNSKKRGFINYAKLVLKELYSFTPFTLSITSSQKKKYTNVFICAIANTSQYGNNFKIAPSANASDGMLEFILITRPKTKIGIVNLLLQSFTGRIEKNKHYHRFQISDKITVKTNYLNAHLDGEPFVSEPEITCEVLEGVIDVLI